MKVDGMDAQMNYVQPTQQAPQPAGQSKGESSEEHQDVGKVGAAGGADKTDLATLLANKPISELSAADKENLSVSEKSIISAIEKANKVAMGRNTTFRFSVHEATKRISVKVLDADTNEVIREIPPEKVLDLVAKMWDMAGLFVDEKR